MSDGKQFQIGTMHTHRGGGKVGGSVNCGTAQWSRVIISDQGGGMDVE